MTQTKHSEKIQIQEKGLQVPLKKKLLMSSDIPELAKPKSVNNLREKYLNTVLTLSGLNLN